MFSASYYLHSLRTASAVVSVHEKRKQTAFLVTVVNECPVLCGQRNRMKLVLERRWSPRPQKSEGTRPTVPVGRLRIC